MSRYLLMIIASVCLGFIGIFAKLIDGALPILTLNALRLGIGALGVLAILWFRKGCTLCDWKKQFKHNLIGGVLIAIAFTAYVTANVMGPITNAVILLYLNPVFVMIFGWIFLRERIMRRHVISFLGAFIGIIILNPLQSGVFVANVLAFSAAVFYGGYIVYMRKNSLSHTFSFLFWSFLISALLLAPFSITELFYSDISFVVEQLWVIPLGLISTSLGYALFSYSLEKMPAENGAIIAMSVTPLVAIIAAIMIFSETPTLSTLLGGALMIGSVVYLQYSKKTEEVMV